MLSFFPIIFNYGYVFISSIPKLYLIRFLLNWMIFPVMLVLINFLKVFWRKIKPRGSILVSFFVMLMCYGSVFLQYYAYTKAPFDRYSVYALFLTNLYFFMPFAVIFTVDIFFIIIRRKQKKKASAKAEELKKRRKK